MDGDDFGMISGPNPRLHLQIFSVGLFFVILLFRLKHLSPDLDFKRLFGNMFLIIVLRHAFQ